MTENPLKTWRETQDPPLKQKEAAALLNVSKPTWSRWETGRRKPHKSMLPKIKEKTGLPARIVRPDLVEILNDEVAA